VTEKSEKQISHAFRGAPMRAFVFSIAIRAAAPILASFGLAMHLRGVWVFAAFIPLLVAIVWDHKWAMWAAFFGGSLARVTGGRRD